MNNMNHYEKLEEIETLMDSANFEEYAVLKQKAKAVMAEEFASEFTPEQQEEIYRLADYHGSGNGLSEIANEYENFADFARKFKN